MRIVKATSPTSQRKLKEEDARSEADSVQFVCERPVRIGGTVDDDEEEFQGFSADEESQVPGIVLNEAGESERNVTLATTTEWLQTIGNIER